MHAKVTQLDFHSTLLLSAHTPFGCNKTTDQSHWLLTATDIEGCRCWKAAWEMFITHKACRFGQQKNSGLIKWRPGAAGGEIHTRPHRHPHVLWQSLKPQRILMGCECGWKKKKKFFCFFFCNSGNLLSFGNGHIWRTAKSWPHDTSDVNASSGSRLLLRRNVTACFFFFFLQEPAGVSDACLAHCITLTRRDSIFLNMAEPEALFP